MCSTWHKSYNLILTCSLDQTARLWNYDNLCAKFGHFNTPGTKINKVNIHTPNESCIELYGILRGHMSGINWSCFDDNRPNVC